MNRETLDDKQKILDKGNDHKYFTIIPNIIDDLELSVYGYRLYGRIKRVAGEEGKCFQSTDTLAEACSMSKSSVSRAKEELVEKGLIKIIELPSKHGQYPGHEIHIIDIWAANMREYTEKLNMNVSTVSGGNGGGPEIGLFSIHRSPGSTDRSPGSTDRSPGSIKEEPFKENTLRITERADLTGINLPPEIAESVQEASNLLAEEREEVSMSFGIPVEGLSTPPYLPPEIPAMPTPGIPEPPAHETDIEYMRRMTKERLAKHGIGAPLPPPSHEAEENRKRGMEAIAKWQEQRRLDLIALENGGIPVQDIQDIPVIEDYLAKVEEDIRPLARVFCYSHRRPPRDKSEDSYWRKEWWGQRVMGITPEDTTKAIYRMRKGDGKGGNILSIKSPASITAFADEERIKRTE